MHTVKIQKLVLYPNRGALACSKNLKRQASDFCSDFVTQAFLINKIKNCQASSVNLQASDFWSKQVPSDWFPTQVHQAQCSYGLRNDCTSFPIRFTLQNRKIILKQNQCFFFIWRFTSNPTFCKTSLAHFIAQCVI